MVDNNSTDETPTIISNLAGSHATIMAARCDRPGPSAARNHGLSLAQGTWIQFLDADDELSPDKLAHQLAVIDEHTQWIIGGYRNHFPDGTVTDNLPHPSPWKGLVFQYRIGCTHANLFRADALRQIGGWDESLPDNEDPELHFQLLKKEFPYAILPTVLCSYHHHGSLQLNRKDPAGGNARRLALLEKVNQHLRQHKPEYWKTHQAYFFGATLRALRVYASYDLGAAAGAYQRIIKQGWQQPPELIAPWMMRAYQLLGFRRTEHLRLILSNWLPERLKDHLKNFGR